MKIVVVYIYPFNGANGRDNFGIRFVNTYKANPAEYDHELIVVSNGEDPNEATQKLFGDIPNMRFFRHDNSGYDIGAYQHVSKETEADLMVFFSNSAYLRRPGWLKRMVHSMEKYNPNNLYGSMQVPDATHAGIWPHIRTTGFWLPPKIFNEYPMKVTDPGQRYPFEHGPDSLTMWCARNYGCYVATYNNLYDMNQWRQVVDGYHWGEQKELLTGDRMSCPPYHPHS